MGQGRYGNLDHVMLQLQLGGGCVMQHITESDVCWGVIDTRDIGDV